MTYIDARPAVAVIVVVRLPEAAERIDGHFIIVAEIMREHLDLAAVEIAPQDIRRGRVCRSVSPRCGRSMTGLPFFVLELMGKIAEIEIPTCRPARTHRVNTMVMVHAGDAR